MTAKYPVSALKRPYWKKNRTRTTHNSGSPRFDYIKIIPGNLIQKVLKKYLKSMILATSYTYTEIGEYKGHHCFGVLLRLAIGWIFVQNDL